MFKEELIIIRHARSKHNVRLTDSIDEDITEFGERQARNVGRFLREELQLDCHAEGWSYFTSPFLRCLQTSRILQHWMTGVKFEIMHELREYLNHTGRQCFVPSRAKEFIEFDWSWYAEEGTTYYDEFNENYLHRMCDAYNKLPQKSLVVTHGLPAFTLMHIAKGNVDSVPIWDHSIDNCSITYIKRGRVIWHGRNLYHEFENYDRSLYHRFAHDGVTRQTESNTTTE